MKTIMAMSVTECFEYVIFDQNTEPYIIISIQDSQGGFGFTFNETRYCKDVLTLYFDDIIHPAPGLKLFTKRDAAKIINFIEKNIGITKILIHCYAGFSRSVAVAQFIEKHYDDWNVKTFDYVCPNSLVLNLLKEEFEESISKK